MPKGSFADLSNFGSWSGELGVNIPASFLEQFTDDKRAHLDIAETAISGIGRPF